MIVQPAKRASYRTYLQREFDSRCKRNPHYSLRAFARDLEMTHSKLSEILRHKVGLSAGMAKSIGRRLRLSDVEIEHFVALVESEHSRSLARRREAKLRADLAEAALGYREIDLERFSIISDWISVAILELLDVRGFKPNSKWIARRLDISVVRVRSALDRLFELGFLAEDPAGKWINTIGDIATPDTIPSRAKRDFHVQVLKKALEAIEEIEPGERDFSSMTFSFSSDQLEEARAVIRDFRRSFTKRFQKKDPKDSVFSLSVQLFPLDKSRSSK